MQHPKESKGYSIPSRAFSGTVHAHEGYFCLFSHQTEACTFHPSWRRAVSLSLSHLRDRQHGMIWQDKVDALTQPGEELVEASFAVSQQDSISSLLLVPENPAGVGLRPWDCNSAERGQLSLTEGILTLPSWTSIHSEGAVSPGPPPSFSNVISPWGGRHRSPGELCYLLTVHGHTNKASTQCHHYPRPSVLCSLIYSNFNRKAAQEKFTSSIDRFR